MLSPETRHKPRNPLTAGGWDVEESVLPDEFPAVGTVGGLPQVCGHKLMSIDLMDSPSHSPLALPGKMLEDAVSLESGCV